MIEPAIVMFRPVDFGLGLSLVAQSISTQQGMYVSAQLRLLLQEILARAHQVAILFQFHVWDVDNTHHAIGVELRQLPCINTIGLDLFAARAGSARGGNDTAMIAIVYNKGGRRYLLFT